MKRLLIRLKYPKPQTIFTAFLFSSVALFGLFRFHVVYPAAWAAVLAVFIWALITAGILLYWLLRSRKMREEIELIELLQKKSISLSLSWLLNMSFFLYYMIISMIYKSAWFATIAFFYIFLSVGRMVLLAESRFKHPNIRSQWRSYMTCGYLMLAMMVSLIVMAVMVVEDHYAMSYPGHTIWAAGIFAVYLSVTALRGYITTKKWRSPMLSAERVVAMSAALLGLFSFQTAFFSQSHLADATTHFWNIATGVIISIIMFCISVYMIVHGGRMLSYKVDLDRKNH